MNNLPEQGPILDDEKELLQALIKMHNPDVVVEFGFFWGKSAKAMLAVMHDESILYSYDSTRKECDAYRVMENHPRFKFFNKCQTEFHPVDVNYARIDLVFIDASHNFDKNCKTYQLLLPFLSERAIIIVHDTGLWKENIYNVNWGNKVYAGFAHEPEERRFVNWIHLNHPEWQQIHLNNTRNLSHGFTILQKYNFLEI